MRSISMAVTLSHTPVSAIGSASITKPGFTPVPSTATRARLASASIRFAAAALLFTGYASSSVVETIGTLSLSTASNSGSTFFRDELVHNTATSGFVDLIVRVRSAVTFTRRFRPTPQTRPRSWPTFAGSISTRADDDKSFSGGQLAHDAGADGTETDHAGL